MTQVNSSPPEPPAHARIVHGQLSSGRQCRVVDHSGQVPHGELAGLLNALIDQGAFGLTALSQPGSGTIDLGKPKFSHIQLGDALYSLVVYRYEAHVTRF